MANTDPDQAWTFTPEITTETSTEEGMATVSYTMHQRLLTVPEVAQALNASERAVRTWIDAGRIEAIYLGRSVRVHPDELARVLREGLPR